jgi:mRNA-degrading endonuclease toxin of MazEF toxin-antitoxin module
MASRLGYGSVTVVPVTPYVDRLFPFQVFVKGEWADLDDDHKALVEQVRSVDVARVGARVGGVPANLMMECTVLKLHLAL